MDKSLWNINLGTPEQSVSYLHEYAVAMIWEALHSDGSSPVYMRTKTGKLSDNLKEGMARVDIPDSLTHVGGMIPDLAIYNSDHRPIRVIQIDVTHDTDADKVERLRKQGVETCIAKIRTPKDLRSLIITEREFKSSLRRFAADADAVNQVVRNIPQKSANSMRQRAADKTIEGIMQALALCSPQIRREFYDMLLASSRVYGRYPISEGNPKAEMLASAEINFTTE